jgi:hypothetical protein
MINADLSSEFLVAYHTRESDQICPPLIAELSALGGKYILPNLWVLESDQDEQQLQARLSTHVGVHDSMLVARLTSYAGLRLSTKPVGREHGRLRPRASRVA